MAFLVGATWSLCGKQSQEDSHVSLALGFLVLGSAVISLARRNQSAVRSEQTTEADLGYEDEYVKVERDDLMGVLVLK